MHLTAFSGSLFESFGVSYDSVNNVISISWAKRNLSRLGNVTLTYGVIGIGDCIDLNLTNPITR